MANYFPQTYMNTYTPYAYGAPLAPAQSAAASTYNQEQLGMINWVQGEAGARSIPVPAGQKALLMDSESNIFYIKSSDASGMPLPLRTFEYKEINKSSTNKTDDSAPSTFVTHEELEQELKELKVKSKEVKKGNEFSL